MKDVLNRLLTLEVFLLCAVASGQNTECFSDAKSELKDCWEVR